MTGVSNGCGFKTKVKSQKMLTMQMKPGFSLIELVVVMLITAILVASMVPRITLFTPSACDEFALNFSRLLRFAYVRAISTGKMHRIFFRVENSTMHIEVEKSKSSLGKRVFEPLGIMNAPTNYTWNAAVKIRNFFIKKMDENARGSLKDVWMYVLSAGLTQEVIINIEDDQRHNTRGLVVNPFSSQCVVHETMQQP